MTTTLTAAVRNIHVPNLGVKPALCVPSATDCQAVISDTDGIRVVTITLDEFVKAEAVHTTNGAEYPLSRFADTLVKQSRKEGALQRPFSRAAARLVAPFVSAELEFRPETTARARKASSGGEKGGTLVARICAELSLAPKKARRILRKAGMKAPYTDEAKVRAALTSKPAPAAKAEKKVEAKPADATPAKATKKARKASAPVAQDGAPINPDLTPKARRAAAQKPSRPVKVEVQPAA